jgi:hypothetical protein
MVKTFALRACLSAEAKEVRFLVREDFSLRHNIQTGSGTHPANYKVVTAVFSSG